MACLIIQTSGYVLSLSFYPVRLCLTHPAKGVTLMVTRSQPERRRRSWLRIFLLIPFIALLYPPLYNSADPMLIGMPFFYWYSLLWIILTAILTAALYFLGA